MGVAVIELGKTYRDTMTGLEGVAISRHEYLYGCVRISLEFLKDGQIKTETFDEQRLTKLPSATSGGDRDEPSRPSVPER